MKTKTLNWTEFDKVTAAFESRLEHRRKNPGDKSDLLFYEFWVKYLKNIRKAKDEGKYLAAHAFGVPTEILYAMDIVPMHMQTCIGLAAVADLHADCLNSAMSFGMTQESCSVNRLSTGFFLNGLWPQPDIFIGGYTACDGVSKNTDLVRALFDCPYFHFEKPYRYSDEAIHYIVEQLREMIDFLETQTHRKLDRSRLEQHLDYALQMADLHKKINELRKNVPTPLRSRKVPELELADFYFCGAPEGTEFYQSVFDEAKERVKRREGAIPNERFRLASPYVFPTYCWKLVEWMEKEWGAIHVMELFFSHWGKGKLDPKTPFQTIAKKLYAHPIVGTQGGPLDMLIPYIINDAKEYKPDAMVWWAHRGCPHGCASIHATSEALQKQFGIPVLELDSDYVDPAFEPESRMKDRLNDFFEMLAVRRG